jgi:arylsulfatase A-like enzyme
MREEESGMRRAGPAVAAALLGGLLWTTACASERSEPLHVVVFVVDTLRADRLGAYGYARDTSPFVDAIAAEGVLFEQAVSAAPRTWQSFVSILTGLDPPRHGVRFVFDRPLRPETPTLASLLAAAGYRTLAFDGMTFLRGMTGGTAFQEYVQPPAGEMWGDTAVVDAFIRQLEAHKEGPLFAFLRLGAPHWPYTCPGVFHQEVGGHERIDHAFNAGGHGLGLGKTGIEIKDADAYRKRTHDYDHSPEVMEHMALHYDECVHHSDAEIGRALAALARLGLSDSTLVVVTSDHGESLGEHGYLSHGPQVDEPVMRVPLVLRFPASSGQARRGVRVAQLVRLVDVAPTLLDAAGLPPVEGLDGVSLLPAVDQARDLGLTAYGESGRGFPGVDPDRYLPGVVGKLRMVRTDRWKLVHIPDGRQGIDRLYDLAHGETEDLSGEHPDVAARLRAQLDGSLAADARRAGGDASLSEEQKELLRRLGYL